MTDAIGLGVLRSVVEHAPQAVVIVGHDGTVRLWNAAAEQLLGWTAEQTLGQRDPSVMDEDVAGVDAGFHALLDDPSTLTRRVVRRRRSDGGMVHAVIDSLARIELEDGPALALWALPAADLDGLLAARNRLSGTLVRTNRTEEITPVVIDALAEMVGATGGVVLRVCPSGAHLHGLWALGVDQAEVEQLQLPATDGPWADALAGDDSTKERGVGRGPLTLEGREHLVAFVPMGPSEDGWVLAVVDADQVGLTTVSTDLARAIADETYIALQRAELISQLDGKIEILEATTALASTVGLDMDDALVSVTTQAAAALSCERSAVYLVTEGGDVELAHVHDVTAAPNVLRATSDGLTLAQEVVAAGSQVLYQDVSSCEAADGPWHEDAGTVAVLGLPLTVAGRTIGALIVAHTIVHPRGFTTLCTQVGSAVAQQAAIALEQARLYELERGTVVRLRELERMKADWMAGLTHDLKAPLTGLLGFVETLRRLSGQVTAEQQAQFLEIMARQAGQLVALVEDLLLSARIDADVVARRRELIPISELIADAAEGFDHAQQSALVVVDEAMGASVVGDRLHLQRVVQNLLSNAWRHGSSGVKITASNSGGDVVVTVDDDGPGVPVADRELVFERFQHGDAAGSTGLGLYVAQGIAVAHGGSLRALDNPSGTGARFELRLPHSRRQRQDDLGESDRRENRGVVGDRRRPDIDLSV